MGCFDTVLVPCPKCGKLYEAQSKGGRCVLMEYNLSEAPEDVLSDVNRHAPFTCECGTIFLVWYDEALPSPIVTKTVADVEACHGKGWYSVDAKTTGSKP